VVEAQMECVEEVPVHHGAGVSVGGVANQGVAYVGHMHSDLVGAACFQGQLLQAVGLELLSHQIAGTGFFATHDHRHAGAAAGVAGYRCVYLSF